MTERIGYLQWVKRCGLGDPEEPILHPMTTFQNKDAVLDLQPEQIVAEPEWFEAEFIVRPAVPRRQEASRQPWGRVR